MSDFAEGDKKNLSSSLSKRFGNVLIGGLCMMDVVSDFPSIRMKSEWLSEEKRSSLSIEILSTFTGF